MPTKIKMLTEMKIITKKKIKPQIIRPRITKEMHFKKLNTACKKAFNKSFDVLATNFNPFLGLKFHQKLRNYASQQMVDYIYKKTKSKIPETRKDFLELLENAKRYSQTNATLKYGFHLNYIKKYIN